MTELFWVVPVHLLSWLVWTETFWGITVWTSCGTCCGAPIVCPRLLSAASVAHLTRTCALRADGAASHATAARPSASSTGRSDVCDREIDRQTNRRESLLNAPNCRGGGIMKERWEEENLRCCSSCSIYPIRRSLSPAEVRGMQWHSLSTLRRLCIPAAVVPVSNTTELIHDEASESDAPGCSTYTEHWYSTACTTGGCKTSACDDDGSKQR